MSEIIYQTKGGVLIPTEFGSISATWPFGILELYSDRVLIILDCESRLAKILFPIYLMAKLMKVNRKLTYYFDDIVSIEHKRYIPFFADGIKITAKGSKPGWIIFWCLPSAKKILEEFEKIGLYERYKL